MAEDKISRDSEGDMHDDEECSQEAFKEDEVELARAEMSEVREENARLKMLLDKIEKDYKSLQMRFVDICQPQPAAPKKGNNGGDDGKNKPSAGNNEEHELISLCLGRSSPNEPKKHCDNDASISLIKTKEKHHQGYDHLKQEGDLKLCLDFNSSEDSKSDRTEVQTDPSPENSALEKKDEEEEGREIWPPSKVLKTMRSSGDDDISQAGVKRARVSVRTRCDTPTMNDGCQWRKYGQKIAKGNPCPRAYYRCTVAPSCPVRKQVQRCAEDMSILITTYEGTHNHPLPISATAMASTTSAAASMLLSGSSSTSLPASSSLSSTLIGLNLNLSDNSKSRPYYLPSSSPPSYPTITLDLTNDPSAKSTQFNMFSSSSFQSTPRLVTSTSLSFASSQPSVLSSSVWGSGNLNYGANAVPLSKNHMMASLQPGRTSHQLPFIQKNYRTSAPSQQVLTETLTKAITSDPSFRSVIAAAITTMVGGGGGVSGGASAVQANNNKLEDLGKKLKWDDQTTAITSSNPLGANKGYASSFLDQASFSAPQSVSLRQQQPQPPFSISKGPASSTISEN